MARDYKHTTSRKNKPAATPAWLAFASGLGLGLLIALFAYLHRPAPALVPAAGVPALNRPAPDGNHPAPAPPAATAATPAKPKFDFYTILPEMEVKVPDWQLGNAGKGSQAAAALAPGAYVLQVGSYQRFEEADKAKANLALHGISADIQRVVVNGGDTWYRVRIGPFKDLSEVQAMRAKLMETGQDFMLLRVKDGQT